MFYLVNLTSLEIESSATTYRGATSSRSIRERRDAQKALHNNRMIVTGLDEETAHELLLTDPTELEPYSADRERE